MHWYLIHTKPRLENLERQNYRCYLPMLMAEKLRKSQLTLTQKPLFPRYLFIQLETGLSALSWSPIRSTKGVSRYAAGQHWLDWRIKAEAALDQNLGHS